MSDSPDTTGTWTDTSGVPRDPNLPTDGDDIYFGDTTASGLVMPMNAGGGDDTLITGTGYVLMGGGDGNDSLVAGAEGGEYFGNAGDDTLVGGGAADLLNGGEGNDVIQGGAGPDTMGLTGAPAEYSWTSLPDGGWIVTDLVMNRDGTDTVATDVERVF